MRVLEEEGVLTPRNLPIPLASTTAMEGLDTSSHPLTITGPQQMHSTTTMGSKGPQLDKSHSLTTTNEGLGRPHSSSSVHISGSQRPRPGSGGRPRSPNNTTSERLHPLTGSIRPHSSSTTPTQRPFSHSNIPSKLTRASTTPTGSIRPHSSPHSPMGVSFREPLNSTQSKSDKKTNSSNYDADKKMSLTSLGDDKHGDDKHGDDKHGNDIDHNYSKKRSAPHVSSIDLKVDDLSVVDSYDIDSPRAIFLAGCLQYSIPPITVAVLRKKISSSINLAHMGIGNKVATVLASCIDKLPYLQLLDLTDNNLSDEGLSALLLSIAKHKTLQILDVSQNVIGPDSASALASYVSDNVMIVVMMMVVLIMTVVFILAMKRDSSISALMLWH